MYAEIEYKLDDKNKRVAYVFVMGTNKNTDRKKT